MTRRKVPRLGAVLIVRNEASRIDACLTAAHAAGVRVVTLVDTGSDDDTVAIAKACAKRLGFRLRTFTIPFEGFGQVRTFAFEQAQGQAEWVIALDADMELSIDPDFEPDASLSAYTVEMGSGGFSYRLPLVLNGSILFKSVGAVHEYTAVVEGTLTSQPTDKVRIDMSGAGNRSSTAKSEWHLSLLDAELAENPDNARDIFYRAQTLRDLGRLPEAREAYARRATMGGFDQEAAYAAFMAATLAPDWPTRATELMAAWEMRPQRLEPLGALLREMNSLGQHHMVYAIVKSIATETIPPETVFVHTGIWRWGIRFERSIASWWVGRKDECRTLCDELLAMDDLPANIRTQVLSNRAL